MGKGWSILFAVVLGASFLIWLLAPAMGWWLPENVASFGGDVDYLFYVILAFTGFFFLLTEALLVYALYKYAYRPGEKAEYVEGNHRLEVLWTIVPAAILLFIAFAQVKAWERIKYATRMPEPTQTVQVTGRQWEWRLRYPSDVVRPVGPDRNWAELPEYDDLHVVNELHTWKGARVKIFLKTVDVLHSFGMPNLRLMQDALPGKTIPMWFSATEANARLVTRAVDVGGRKVVIKNTEVISPQREWEIACKELCGNGHYRMRGQLYVYETRQEYDDWLAHQRDLQHHGQGRDALETAEAARRESNR